VGRARLARQARRAILIPRGLPFPPVSRVSPRYPVRCSPESRERRVVAVLLKDDGPTGTTIEHMVGVSGDLAARNARHGGHGDLPPENYPLDPLFLHA
jgi:hypothetical protein